MADPVHVAARLAVELWKLLSSFERAAADLPSAKQGKVAAQLRFTRTRFEGLLEEMGLQLLTFEGQPYSANLPASPVNAEDVGAVEDCTIISTIEPAVVGDGKVLIMGKVFLMGD